MSNNVSDTEPSYLKKALSVMKAVSSTTTFSLDAANIKSTGNGMFVAEVHLCYEAKTDMTNKMHYIDALAHEVALSYVSKMDISADHVTLSVFVSKKDEKSTKS